MYKILIVDNEAAIRIGLSAGVDWTALDCTVIGTAENGLQALEFIKKDVPDIIISDINMEIMDGIKMCRKLYMGNPSVKCILITGFQYFDNIYQAMQCPNVVSFILKPSSVYKISNAVLEAIKRIEDEKAHQNLQKSFADQTRLNNELKRSIGLLNILDGLVKEKGVGVLLQDLGIDIGSFAVLTIQISSVSENKTGNHESLLEAEKTVCRYINRIFSSKIYNLIVKPKVSIRVLLHNPDAMRGIYDLCTELVNVVDKCTDFYVGVGISRIHHGGNELVVAAKESENAAKFALYTTDTPIADCDMIPQLSPQNAGILKNKLDDLINAISQLDIDTALTRLKELQLTCEEIKLTFLDTLNICVLISGICVQQYNRYASLNELLSSQFDPHRILSICQSPKELFKGTGEIIRLTVNRLINRPLENVDIVDNVKNYINTNYMSDLSLEGIASVFGFSPGYLGRLFKNKQLINITSYIQNTRIDKAKELMMTTGMHNYEIAEKVGINDPVYFSKLFKKVTGQRVSDFRENKPSMEKE